MKSYLLIGLVISMASSIYAADRLDMVINGRFEEDTNGDGMADYWYFAGDEGVTATWALDKGFEGQFSQKLTCSKYTYLSSSSHVMLGQTNTIQMDEGMWYRISFAAKQEGILSQVVNVSIVNTTTWSDSGLKESFLVNNEWKQLDFVFQATETITKNIRLQFWYTSTGTFWIDDVRLEPAEAIVKRFTEVVPLTSAVNLLPNSSFECGSNGWGSIADLPERGGNLNLPVGEVDSTTSLYGQSSFKIALTPETIPVFSFDYFLLKRVPIKAPLLANRGWITVEPGSDYTLSAYIKTDTEGLTGVLSVKQAFQNDLRREITLTTNWTRYTFTFQPYAEQIFIALGMDLEASNKETGIVWIDGVQLEKDNKATPYYPWTPVEVGLETNSLGNLFTYGSEPEIIATIHNSDENNQSVILNLKTTDFDDIVVHETNYPVDVPAGGTLKISIDPGVRSMGFYRLHLHCEEAKVIQSMSLRFAIIQPYIESESLFGLNHAYPWPHLLDLSKQIGVCCFRDWSLKWQDVEPEKGRFEFTEPDYQINRILERGLDALLLLPLPSSNWSSSAGPEVQPTDTYPGIRERMAYMPRDLEEFATYVRRTVEHYRSQLAAWEILNEPISTSYALPEEKGYQVEDYIQLLSVAYQTAKEADPDSIVVGGIAENPSSHHTQEFIEQDGLSWVDALNLHIFPGLISPETYKESMLQLREKMQSVGADKPIWFTEGAYYADDDKPFEPYQSTWLQPVDSEIQASEWHVKLSTLLLTYGAEKIIFHAGTCGSLNNVSLEGIFFEWGAAPRKMLVAQSAMANLLSLPIRPLGALDSPEGMSAYGFESNGRTIIVAWMEEGVVIREIDLADKAWRVVDLQGNELQTNTILLTERPVYFIAEGTMQTELPW